MANSMSQKNMSLGTLALTAMIVLIVVLGMVASPPLSAQEAGGTIVGTVTDPSGAAVASASVIIKNVATGIERNSTTNADGVYTAPNLIPGTYEVTITSAGFSTVVVQGIGLLAGEKSESSGCMKLGQVYNKGRVVNSEISELQFASF